MTSSAWTIRVGFLTDTGRERERNEDAFSLYLPYPGEESVAAFDAILLVADGMGGHEAGDAASQFVADTLIAELTARAERFDQPERTSENLRALLRRVDRDLRAHAKWLGLGNAGSTATLAALDGATLFIGHVGDSRLYRFREGTLEQLTPDHSWVAEQLRAGLMGAEEAMTHPRRNLLTQCLGIGQPPTVASLRTPVAAGDRYLLCTDGLHAAVPDHIIGRVLQDEHEPQRASNRLVAIANEAGGPDNVTAIVFDLQVAGVLSRTERAGVAAASPAATAENSVEHEVDEPDVVDAVYARPRQGLTRAIVVGGLLLTLGGAALAAWHFLGPAGAAARTQTIPAAGVLRDTTVEGEGEGEREGEGEGRARGDTTSLTPDSGGVR